MKGRSNNAILQDICKETKQRKNQNQSFFVNLSNIIDNIPNSKFIYRKIISKRKIQEFYRDRTDFVPKIKIINKNIIGVLQEVKSKRRFNSSKEDRVIENNILFKIGNKEIRVTKRPRLFLNHLRNIFPGNVREQDIFIENQNGKEFIKLLFNIETKLPKVNLNGINTFGINVGKNIWININSEEKDKILDKIKKIKYGTSFIFGKKLENFRLSNLRQINFREDEEEARLLVSPIGIKQFRIYWKHGSNLDLRKEISNYLHIPYEGSCVILDYANDEERIYDFFKENRIDWLKKNILYKDLLQKYSDFIEIDQKDKPRLKMERIFSVLNRIAKTEKYKLEKIYLRRVNSVFFPMRKSKKIKTEGLKPSNCFFRITDNKGKIIQHFFLDHEFLDKNDVKEFLDSYFIFHPLVALDYRLEDLEPFSINTGIFIKSLKNNPKLAFEKLLRDKDSISNKERDIYFNNAKRHLENIEAINHKLHTQQKGAYFESICFSILSQIFLTKRIGNRLNPDGKFILDDEKILYDAKNIASSNSTNSLLQSVTNKRGKIKDIDYIIRGGVKKYLFIVKNLRKKDFEEVKFKIESAINCNVSAIEVNVLKKVVDYYNKDNLEFSKSKFKSILFSGTLRKNITKKEVMNNI